MAESEVKVPISVGGRPVDVSANATDCLVDQQFIQEGKMALGLHSKLQHYKFSPAVVIVIFNTEEGRCIAAERFVSTKFD